MLEVQGIPADQLCGGGDLSCVPSASLSASTYQAEAGERTVLAQVRQYSVLRNYAGTQAASRTKRGIKLCGTWPGCQAARLPGCQLGKGYDDDSSEGVTLTASGIRLFQSIASRFNYSLQDTETTFLSTMRSQLTSLY